MEGFDNCVEIEINSQQLFNDSQLTTKMFVNELLMVINTRFIMC